MFYFLCFPVFLKSALSLFSCLRLYCCLVWFIFLLLQKLLLCLRSGAMMTTYLCVQRQVKATCLVIVVSEPSAPRNVALMTWRHPQAHFIFQCVEVLSSSRTVKDCFFTGNSIRKRSLELLRSSSGQYKMTNGGVRESCNGSSPWHIFWLSRTRSDRRRIIEVRRCYGDVGECTRSRATPTYVLPTHVSRCKKTDQLISQISSLINAPPGVTGKRNSCPHARAHTKVRLFSVSAWCMSYLSCVQRKAPNITSRTRGWG